MKRTSSALKKAAALFDQRLPVSSKEFLELSEALQAQSFTMAKVWNETFLDELQTSLAKAIESGMSFEAWYPKAQKLLASFGGKVKVAVRDEFGLMDPSYARLVFNVATEGAFAAARYSTMFSSARVESHPYVVYHTARDNRVRPAHRLLEGRVFDKNDASARRLLPPSDYNCRCWVTDLTAEEKSDGGYRLSKGSSFDRPPGDWNVDRVKALVPDTYKRTFRASAADEEYEGEFLKRIYLMAANQPRAPKGTHEGGQWVKKGGQPVAHAPRVLPPPGMTDDEITLMQNVRKLHKEGKNAEVKAIAKEMGFPERDISWGGEEGPTFFVNGMKAEEGGHYDPNTKTITIYGQFIDRGAISHEISHAKFDAAKGSESAFRRKVVDGLGGKEEAAVRAALKKSDGLTQYSRDCWRDRKLDLTRKINETLAEIARLREWNDGKIPDKRVAAEWRALFEHMERAGRL